jgi:hypothetical protein
MHRHTQTHIPHTQNIHTHTLTYAQTHTETHIHPDTHLHTHRHTHTFAIHLHELALFNIKFMLAGGVAHVPIKLRP